MFELVGSEVVLKGLCFCLHPTKWYIIVSDPLTR